jgi:DNA-binding GntR family transcriptional regulator
MLLNTHYEGTSAVHKTSVMKVENSTLAIELNGLNFWRLFTNSSKTHTSKSYYNIYKRKYGTNVAREISILQASGI